MRGCLRLYTIFRATNYFHVMLRKWEFIEQNLHYFSWSYKSWVLCKNNMLLLYGFKLYNGLLPWFYTNLYGRLMCNLCRIMSSLFPSLIFRKCLPCCVTKFGTWDLENITSLVPCDVYEVFEVEFLFHFFVLKDFR